MRTRSLLTRCAAAAALSLGSVALLPAGPASAAPGDPFDPNTPVVFVSKGSPPNITLFRQVIGGDGSADYAAEGGASATDFNALAYNLDDHYLYAITNAAADGIPEGSLLRIGEGGTIERVGTSTFPASAYGAGSTIVDQGAYNPDDNLLYTLSTGRGTMIKIDPTTGESAGTVALSQTTGAANGGYDIAYQGGFFWSLNGSTIVRIDPTSGEVTSFTVPGTPAGAHAGAAWTFGNGNLGFSHNESGAITQIAITDPSGVAPTFEIVSQSSGIASTRNDGTNIPGAPADLAIAKTAVVDDEADTVTYTLTVTNEGAGASSGWVVEDALPAELSNIAVTSPGTETVDGHDVEVVGGPLAVDASVDVTITADLPDPFDPEIENVATVTGNEADPVPGNNVDSAAIAPPAPALGLDKRVADVVDVNTNGVTDPGDQITWEFDVANTGNVDLTDVGVTDPLAGPITCDPTDLPPGDSVVCTTDAPYTITAADAEAGGVTNTATAHGTDPNGGAVQSAPDTTVTEVVPTPVVENPVEEPADDDTDDLPDAGAPSVWIAATGLLLACAGAAVVRRRRI